MNSINFEATYGRKSDFRPKFLETVNYIHILIRFQQNTSRSG